MKSKPVYALVLALPTLVGGCATTQFSTPAVNGEQLLSADGKCKAKVRSGNDTAIGRDVTGALNLIENYRISYDCALRSLANGRQYFEVPSALALAGGAAAAAFGAGPAVAIATGATSATLNHGNSYYAPKEKAHIMSAAYNAVVCIKQEASGIPALDVTSAQAASASQMRVLGSDPDRSANVSFKPEVQYYQLVSAALEDVSSILAERLSSVGSYSPDAIAKEIAQLSAEQQKAESDAAKNDAQNKVKALHVPGESEDVIVSGLVELGKLQPRLQLCVLRAKAG